MKNSVKNGVRNGVKNGVRNGVKNGVKNSVGRQPTALLAMSREDRYVRVLNMEPLRTLVLCAILATFGPAISTAGAQPQNGPARRGWVSVGIGAEIGPSNGLALTTGGTYTAGPVAFVARLDGTGTWFGEQLRGKALLLGARTDGSRWFATVAAGIARTHALHTCECGTTEQGRSTVLALEAKAFHALEVASSSVAVYATIGPRRHRTVALTVSRDFGWFGPVEW